LLIGAGTRKTDKGFVPLEDRQRIIFLVIANIWATGEFAGDDFSKMIDAMMCAAVEFMKTIPIVHNKKNGIAAS